MRRGARGHRLPERLCELERRTCSSWRLPTSSAGTATTASCATISWPSSRRAIRRTARAARARPDVVARAGPRRGGGRVRAGGRRLGGTRAAGRGAPVPPSAHGARSDARTLDGRAPARGTARAPERAGGDRDRGPRGRPPGDADPAPARACTLRRSRAGTRRRRRHCSSRLARLHRETTRRGLEAAEAAVALAASRPRAAGRRARRPRAHAPARRRRRRCRGVRAIGARASGRRRAAVRLHRRGVRARDRRRMAGTAMVSSHPRRRCPRDDPQRQPRPSLVGLARGARRCGRRPRPRAASRTPSAPRSERARHRRGRPVAGVGAARARRDRAPPGLARRPALARASGRAARSARDAGRCPRGRTSWRRALDRARAGHARADRAAVAGRARGPAAAAAHGARDRARRSTCRSTRSSRTSARSIASSASARARRRSPARSRSG